MRQKYPDLLVNKQDSILYVLKKMDQTCRKLLIVMDGDKFSSLISIGDIQRAIIKDIDLNAPIYQILRKEVTVASSEDNINQIKELMRLKRIDLMPVVAPSGDLGEVILWEDLFEDERPAKAHHELNLPVIIMAGGVGTRLKPLTNILPKALIPIRSKTIIEEIMDRFLDCGCYDFFISVNYKAEMIRYYLDSLNNQHYKISYIHEDKPLGTAGSLFLIKNKINSTFFVSNCDILIDEDYSVILEYHRKNKNEITIVAAINTISIPYGTLETSEGGFLKAISEKPEYSFKINTGMYILEPHLLNEIPDNEHFHITALIEKLHNEQRKVGVFPINEGAWIDIGNWDKYLKFIKK